MGKLKQNPRSRAKTLVEMIAGHLASFASYDVLNELTDDEAERVVANLEWFVKRAQQLKNGGIDMRKEYTIGVKINFNDDTRHDAALKIMRAAARKVLTQMLMIQDGREPQVSLQTEDYFEGIDQKDIQEEQDKETRVL